MMRSGRGGSGKGDGRRRREVPGYEEAPLVVLGGESDLAIVFRVSGCSTSSTHLLIRSLDQ